MEKTHISYIVDLGLLLSFLALLITGIVRFPGFLGSFGVHYSELPMKQLSFVHDWSGIIMSFFVFSHIVLYWKSFKNMTQQFFRGKQ